MHDLGNNWEHYLVSVQPLIGFVDDACESLDDNPLILTQTPQLMAI